VLPVVAAEAVRASGIAPAGLRAVLHELHLDCHLQDSGRPTEFTAPAIARAIGAAQALVDVAAGGAGGARAALRVYLGLPGDGDTLELTVNVGRDEPYEVGTGYGHIALTVDDLDATLGRLAEQSIEPETPPYHPGGREEYRICFVADPDGYRVELIDGGEFRTPQDP
jgi:lactoylglutathione lyase